MMDKISRRQFLAALPLAVGALVLAGCSGGQTSTQADPKPVENDEVDAKPSADETQHPQVTEFAWKFLPNEFSGGYTYFTAVGLNPNQNKGALLPAFRVTAYDANGGILGTTDQYVSLWYPNTYAATWGQMDTGGVQPADVKVEIAPIEAYEWGNLDPADTPAYSVDGLTEIPQDYMGPKFTGTVSNPTGEVKSLQIVVVMRDEAGNLVDGCSTYVNDVPAGGSAPFEASSFVDVNPHASIQAYVMG